MRASATITATESTGGEVASPPRLADTNDKSPLGSSLEIEIALSNNGPKLGIELRPSRVAAAWLVWVTVTLIVMAFWLPAPSSRRHRRAALATSSVPAHRRRR